MKNFKNKLKKFSLSIGAVVSVLGILTMTSPAFAVVDPVYVTTKPATAITSTNATLNGTNGESASTSESFWVSTDADNFGTMDPAGLPDGVYSNSENIGGVAANANFSSQLSSFVNISNTPIVVTPNTTYYFFAWAKINGTWRHGETLSFTTSSASLPGSLSAEDFGVVNYDTGLGILKGYTAGFGLVDATFAGVKSVVVKLYGAGDTLLQTNTAILPKFNTDITGVQISSPFDVSGTFNYATDGYWTNVRAGEYGQSVPATKVVATVKLANDKIVTATNTNLTGDPTTIYPETGGTGTEGEIEGTVTGGASLGTLAVTSVTVVKSSATADGTFTNGWKYLFNITVPLNETHVAMKFANWVINGGGSTIPVANNMRISSAQADNSNATVLLTAENTYSTPTLNMTSDLNPSLDGKQVQVLVETAVPLNSLNGTYTSSYGVKTN